MINAIRFELTQSLLLFRNLIFAVFEKREPPQKWLSF